MCATIGNKAQKQGNFVKFSGVIFAKPTPNPKLAKLFQLALKGCGMWVMEKATMDFIILVLDRFLRRKGYFFRNRMHYVTDPINKQQFG